MFKNKRNKTVVILTKSIARTNLAQPCDADHHFVDESVIISAAASKAKYSDLLELNPHTMTASRIGFVGLGAMGTGAIRDVVQE